MEAIVVALASIWVITLLAWAAARAWRWRLCPVCAGVAGTWLWMLAARQLGSGVDTTLLPVLMGGSVVGIAHQLESRLPAGRSPVVWKSIAIPIGFGAAYALEQRRWLLLALALIALAGVAVFSFRPRSAAAVVDGDAVGKLEEQMKKCC
jgi:hypothetical protein